MNAHARRFTAEVAVRDQVPILIGLMGPSGGGKTFSALRLATGIQSVVGGEIFGIDTEAGRMKHYADRFRFKHVPFSEPFGSRDYLEAIRFCIQSGAKVVIVDSMSHEHEGIGGLLDLHEREVDRMAGDNYAKREAVKILAWGKPKAARRDLINALLQMNCNFVFCFRAKNSVKPVKVTDPETGRAKTEVVTQGFMPIAGEEFVFEMTMNALLLPGAGGVPTWNPEHVGEKLMTKLPEQFRDLMARPRALDEAMGVSLAQWARGSSPTTSSTRSTGDFPGDRPTGDPSRQDAPQGQTLSQRIAAFNRRLAEAPSKVKVNAVWAAAELLRRDVDRQDPDELPAMQEAYEARLAEIEMAAEGEP